MDRDTGEVPQHAGVIDAVLAALVVQRIERQRLGADREQPPQPAIDAGARLVEVRDRPR